MQRKILYSLLVLVLSLSLATPAMAQNNGQESAKGEAKSYIVVLQGDPILAYEGDIAGYPATKPGKGEKVNPNSAHVRKYQQLLETQHEQSLQDANAAAAINSYTFALNGYSAVL